MTEVSKVLSHGWNPGDSEPRETTCWAVKCLGTGDSHPAHARLSLAGLQAFAGRRCICAQACTDASSLQCCFLVRTSVVGVLWKGSYWRNRKYWMDCPFKSLGFISPVLLGLSNRNQCMIVMFLNPSLVFCWPIRVHSPNTLLHFPQFYLPLFHFLCFHQLLHIWRVPYDISPFTPDAACQCLYCKMLQFGENPPRLCCLHSIKPSMAQMSRFSTVWKEHRQIFFSLKREITW